MSNKVIVAHPGKQHSFRLAGALYKADMLHSYITTVYDKKGSFLMGLVKKLLGKSNIKRANGRKMEMIPDKKIIQFCSLWGLILLLVLRLDKTRKIYNRLNMIIADCFGKKVAKYAIKNKVDAVICYDTASKKCFEILKKKAPYIVRIMDNAAVNRFFSYNEYIKYGKFFVDKRKELKTSPYLYNIKAAEYFEKEALLADYHIVASGYAKKSLEYIGVNPEKIRIIPYGLDNLEFKGREIYEKKEKLNFLFVGEITSKKGIVQFIDAAKKLSPVADFHIVGGGIEKLSLKELREDILKYTTYHGYVLHEKLAEIYESCDVFVFPTLGDGFGFVLLEAMGAGMPVIASENCAAVDFIEKEENGFIIRAGESEALIEKINYFIENPEQIEIMGRKAYETAKEFTWDRYNEKIAEKIKRILEK